MKVIALKVNGISMVSDKLTSLSSAEGDGAREGTVVETDGARLGGISQESVLRLGVQSVFSQTSSAKPIIRE